MPGDGRASCLLGIRGGAGMTGREVDGGATARLDSELDRTRQMLFIVQVKETSGISGCRRKMSKRLRLRVWNKDFWPKTVHKSLLEM